MDLLLVAGIILEGCRLGSEKIDLSFRIQDDHIDELGLVGCHPDKVLLRGIAEGSCAVADSLLAQGHAVLLGISPDIADRVKGKNPVTRREMLDRARKIMRIFARTLRWMRRVFGEVTGDQVLRGIVTGRQICRLEGPMTLDPFCKFI